MAERAKAKVALLRTDYYISEPIDREALIRELTAQSTFRTGSQFNNTFLDELMKRPEDDVADIWDDVERHFAQETQTPMRRNPYRSE